MSVYCDKQLPEFNDETCQAAGLLQEWIDVICGGDTTILIQDLRWKREFRDFYASTFHPFIWGVLLLSEAT